MFPRPARPSFRRFAGTSLVAAFTLAAGTAAARAAEGAATPAASAGALRLEIETGALAGGARVAAVDGGFSGGGYVTDFTTDADRVTLKFPARAGVYAVSIRYRAPEPKGFLCEVNGLPLSGKFAGSSGRFAEHAFGKVELREGENTVAFHGGWHRYELDRVDLTPLTTLPALAKPSAALCDPRATPAARALMEFLVEHYGRRTLSGAIIGPDVDYVRETTGELPAIIASDLLNVGLTSIRHQGVPDNETDKLLAYARQGHVITLCWHWRSPSGCRDLVLTGPDGKKEDLRWYRSFYTRATDFDVARVLAQPDSVDHALLLADIDLVAGELRKYAEWGVPVLWRPLHESEGAWFWWGAKGPQPFVQLWRLVHDRLTRVHGLHNLIWVYTGTANRAWYPGDDVVDIVGLDEYPASVRDPLSATWDDVQASFGGKKLVALSEFGGVPDLAAARKLGVAWGYFASWSADLGPKKNDPAALKEIYRDPQILNLRDLPRDRWAPFAEPVKLEGDRWK